MKWGCVLLKGGRGSRMGYRDKSELIWRGQTFGFRIRQELEQLGIPCFLSEAEKAAQVKMPETKWLCGALFWIRFSRQVPWEGLCPVLRPVF